MNLAPHGGNAPAADAGKMDARPLASLLEQFADIALTLLEGIGSGTQFHARLPLREA